MRVINLTHTITPDIPVYPGTEPPTFEPANTYERDGFRETLVTMYTHTGTHIDPPYHLYPDRTRLDEFPADRFVGMALRIDCRGIPEGRLLRSEAAVGRHLADPAAFGAARHGCPSLVLNICPLYTVLNICQE